MHATLKVRQILDAESALQQLAGQAKFPARTAYRIGMLQDDLRQASRHYGEQQRALLEKHGAEPEGDGLRIKEPEQIKAYQKELLDLLEEEIAVNVQPLPLSRLEDKEITHTILASLRPFIIDWTDAGERDLELLRAVEPFLKDGVKTAQVLKALKPLLAEEEEEKKE